MPNSAKVQFNIKNFTPGVSVPASGIFYVMGITKRGPIKRPDLFVITNWPQFERIFGGLLDTTDFPLLCQRALLRGAQLRVCRISAAATAAVKAPAKSINNGDASPKALFTARPKYEGADYNKVAIEIKAASNGQTTAWDMAITHSSEPELNEYYPNIAAFNKDIANNQSCLDEVKSMSQLVDFTYNDCSAATLLIPAVAAASAFTGGVDPAGFVPADYSGALTSFNGVDDGMILAIPEQDDDAINAAAATYATNRGDLVFFAHLPNSLTTAADLKTERTTIASNTKHLALFGGGIRIREPKTLMEKPMSEMGDVLGLAAYVHNTYGPWFSLAGQNKGSVSDAIGVVNNFGTPGGFGDLNLLANSQINMMIQKNGIVQLSGNFSGQYANNQEKFLSVVFLVIWLKKTIKPVLEEYLEEPNDTQTFKKIYFHLKPFLDSLSSPDKRAIYKYEYYGDQDANSIDDLQVNNKVDVQNGKYKINLKIWPIPSLQELTFNLMLVQGEGVYIE